jgi:hypothetical protein
VFIGGGECFDNPNNISAPENTTEIYDPVANTWAMGPNGQPGWYRVSGDRIGVYSYNDQADAGYVDIDFFHYRFDGPRSCGEASH